MEMERRELHGDVVRTLDLPHFLVTETRYEGITHLPAHSHHHGYLSMVLQGSYQELHHHRIEDCSTGSLIFHPAEEVHENFFPASESRCLNLHLTFKEVSPDFDLHNRLHYKRGAVVELFKKLYREFCDPDSLSFLIMDGIALALLGEVLRLGSYGERVPRWLKQVEELIHSSFQEKLSISFLAATASVHPVHLSRSFQRYYHCTIGEYLRWLRVDLASNKLCRTNLELSEIALQTGFSDQSALAKSFKRITGYTPAQFRKRFRPR